MPRRSAVSGLPPDVRQWLEEALIQGNFSGYEALSEALKEMGYSISKSSLHRFGQDFEERLGSLKWATEQAKAIVADSPDDEGAMMEALLRLLQDKMFRAVLELKDTGDLTLDKIGRVVADLARASVSQKKWATEYKAKLEAKALASLEKATRQRGLSEEEIAHLKADFLKDY